MDSALKPIDVKSIKPIRNKIIVEGMQFKERYSKGGIFIPSDDMQIQGVHPRWARVYAVGPDQTEIKVGQYVLVAHGRWTRGINITDPDGDHVIRMVDNNDLLMVSDDEVLDENMGTPLTSEQINGAPKGGIPRMNE
jgi:co-chaperonin GroES (HSP10)